MADRNLARATDAVYDENNNAQGWHAVLRIDRSSAGQPGLQFIIEDWDGGLKCGETSIMVADGWALLAPVMLWLAAKGSRDIGELALTASEGGSCADCGLALVHATHDDPREGQDYDWKWSSAQWLDWYAAHPGNHPFRSLVA